MGIGARIAFTMLPIGALAVVIWLAATHHLPLSILHRWVPALGVDLAWRLDGLSMLMLLMITGVGSAVLSIPVATWQVIPDRSACTCCCRCSWWQ
jgi:multicomponent Na+:H+ antiporter subunit A